MHAPWEYPSRVFPPKSVRDYHHYHSDGDGLGDWSRLPVLMTFDREDVSAALSIPTVDCSGKTDALYTHSNFIPLAKGAHRKFQSSIVSNVANRGQKLWGHVLEISSG